jgi:competence protein ComEC
VGRVGGFLVRRAGMARVVTGGSAVGLAAAGLLRPAPLWPALCAAMGLAVTLFVAWSAHAGHRWAEHLLPPLAVAVALALGVGVGSMRVAALTRSTLIPLAGRTMTAEMVVAGQPRIAGGWQTAEVVLESGACIEGMEAGTSAGAGERVVLEWNPTGGAGAPSVGSPGLEPAVLEEGLVLRVEGVLRLPRGPSASGYDESEQLSRRGIAVVVTAESVAVKGRRGGVAGLIDAIRRGARIHLNEGLQPMYASLLRGVVLGEQADIPEEALTAFRRSGTAHILSVGGLHLGALAAVILALVAAFGLPRLLGLGVTCMFVFVFVALTGASPPVVRSAVMIMAVLSGRAVGRARDGWHLLMVAAAAILSGNPLIITSVSFQLTFAAVIGMTALARPLERCLRGLPSALGSSMAVSLAATLGTAPVSMAVFGQVSLSGILANIAVVPVTSAVTVVGLASLAAGFIWLPLSRALNLVCALLLSFTLKVAQFFALFPVLEWGSVGLALCALAGLGGALPPALVLWGSGDALASRSRPLRRLRRAAPRARGLRSLLAGAVVVSGLLLGGAGYALADRGIEAFTDWRGGQSWPATVEARVLDVGQGSAMLIRTPGHHAALIDVGPADCGLAGQLRGLGVTRLDLVVVSHPHADHYGGLLSAKGVRVGMFVDSVRVTSGAVGGGAASEQASGPAPAAASAEASSYLALRAALVAAGATYHEALPGDVYRLDGVDLVLFPPDRPLSMAGNVEDPWEGRARPPTGDELNASSVVVVVSYQGKDILVPGDAEALVLERLALPTCEVLVAPHHGSAGGVSSGLLKALGARAAVISVGLGNTFGHPAASTIALLEQAGVGVSRTDRQGWVAVDWTSAGLEVLSERSSDVAGETRAEPLGGP